MQKFLPSNLKFTDNFCEVVIDALVERLNVEGFTSPTEGVAELAQDWWRLNRMDESQIAVHTDAGVKGDGYVLVEVIERSPAVEASASRSRVPGVVATHGNSPATRIDN